MMTRIIDRKRFVERITTQQQHIIIIEDEETIAKTLQLQLKAHFKVTIFNTAGEALRYIEQHWQEIDLILLDNMLPDMLGLDLLTILKQNSKLKNIPVILQTASYRESLGASSSLADGYLQKPFKVIDILNIITKTLARHEK